MTALSSSAPPRALALAFALLVAAAPARAQVHPQALPVLQHAVEASGGSAAREAERTLHVKGRLEADGLTGRWEMWLAAPDRWMRSYALGSLRIREGYDGARAWRTDLTGRTVTVLSTAALEDAREEGWFLNERWALPDQDGARIRLRSRVYGTGNSGDYDVLEITPPVGRPRRLFVNTRSGLVEREIGEWDQYTVESLPRDYRVLGGRKRATVYQSPTLTPGEKPAERLTVDSVWVNAEVDSARFSPPRVAERKPAWQRASASVRVPFVYASKAVLVMASINGAAPAEFILDTGASLTAIDKDYAYEIGLQGEGHSAVQGVAASGEAQYATVKSIAVQGESGASVALQDFKVGLIDLTRGGQIVMWRKPRGLLGYDFLSRFAVEICYDSSFVRFHDPARFVPDSAAAAVPFELDNGIPVVEMTLEGGCAGRFLVDVGNAFQFVVNGSKVRSCGLVTRRGRKEIEVYGGGVGGGFVSTLCRLDSLRIGPFTCREPVAALALHHNGSIGSKDLAGNIGSSVLERFTCTFDYAHHTLYLAPGRRFGEREGVSRFGAMMARVGDRVLAGNILSGSAAYEAGLLWFDEITAIDDKPLERWSRVDIDTQLEEGPVGSVHKVTFKRWPDLDQERSVEVTLKDAL